MANNFKLRGDYYVSKAGNDANAGTSPDAPKLTFSSGLLTLPTSGGNFLIVGSGVYLESGIRRIDNSTTTNYRVIGDGKVVLDGGGYGTLTFSRTGNSSAGNGYYNNLEFSNYSDLIFDFVSAPTGLQYTFTNCVFKNCKLSNYNTTTSTTPNHIYFLNCYFINCKIETISTQAALRGAISLNRCTLVNSQTYFTIQTGGVSYDAATITCLNSYIDKNSIINFSTSTAVQASLFNFNNIQGKIVMYQNGAVSGPNSFAVAQTFEQHRIDYPTYNVNSFSADPLFNNQRLLDFTLQAGSPNVSASSDYSSNIGGTEYAVTYTASSAAFTTNATSQSLDYRGLYYGISGSAVSGSITSGPMFLQWPRTKPMTSINWIGALDFNKTITASFAGNTNVPAYTTYTSASGQAGANPDRLKIAMRFSTQQTQPSTNAEWDNNGYWTPGTYQLFEINQKPTIDYKGTGNGDPTYAGSSGIGDLVPSWIQTEIILRNDYNR